MTVTVRPFPKRTYQNGIRPFRPVVPANNIRPYTLKTWRPPVPEPLPPAPLLNLSQLLAIGLSVLARQLWGLLNSRQPESAPTDVPAALIRQTGVVGSLGGTAKLIGKRYNVRQTLDTCYNPFTDGPYPVFPYPYSRSYGAGGVSLQVTTAGKGACGYDSITVSLVNADGTIAGSWTASNSGFNPPGAVQRLELEIEFSNSVGDPISLTTTIPGPSRPQQPGVDVEPEPLPEPPRPVPIPFPLAPPTVKPSTLPSVQPSPVPTTPGPTAPPATAPQVPRRTVPLPLPGATPTKDGAIVPQAPAPVAVTPPDAHFPVPGAPPVTGNGPRPTPEGIAQELGRLEQKLARLSDPGPAGNGDGTDRLGLLFQILGNVVEFLTSIQSGGGYGLSSPCELDDNGDRIVTTVEYSGAPTTLGVVLNKLDALAALLQVHKDLKQPICKQTPAVGQPVTVDFLQVD